MFSSRGTQTQIVARRRSDVISESSRWGQLAVTVEKTPQNKEIERIPRHNTT